MFEIFRNKGLKYSLQFHCFYLVCWAEWKISKNARGSPRFQDARKKKDALPGSLYLYILHMNEDYPYVSKLCKAISVDFPPKCYLLPCVLKLGVMKCVW